MEINGENREIEKNSTNKDKFPRRIILIDETFSDEIFLRQTFPPNFHDFVETKLFLVTFRTFSKN